MKKNASQDHAIDLRALHEARAREELATLVADYPGSDVIASRGCLIPSVAVVKGLPGPAEVAGGAAASGADGVAAEKALEALGHDAALVFYAMSRPDSALSAEQCAERIRRVIEAVDAPLVIALDATAAQDLRAGFNIAALPVGGVVRECGRRFVACDGLEAALQDERAKRVAWRQLSAAKPEEPVY